MATLLLLAAILAAGAVFVPFLDCPATSETWILNLGQHDAAYLARVLQALLNGTIPPGRVLRMTCEVCEGRGRISLWRKWRHVLTK